MARQRNQDKAARKAGEARATGPAAHAGGDHGHSGHVNSDPPRVAAERRAGRAGGSADTSDAGMVSQLERAHAPIAWRPDPITSRYLDMHLAARIDIGDLMALLRVDPARLQVRADHRSDHQHIRIPAWARCLELPLPTPIVCPDWAQPAPLPVAQRIVRPAWGRDMRLPVVRSIPVPSGGDVSLTLAELPKDAWALIDEAPPPPPPQARAQTAKKITTSAPSPMARERQGQPAHHHHHQESAAHDGPAARHQPGQHGDDGVRKRKKPKQKPDVAAVVERADEAKAAGHEPAVASVATVSGVQTSRHSGAPGCLGRLLGVALLAFLSWVAVDMGVAALVAVQLERLAQAATAADTAPTALATLTTRGDSDAALQLVLACDLAEVACQQQLRWLQEFCEADGAAAGLPGGKAPRLVFLHAPEPPHIEIAQALQALAMQYRFWQAVAGLNDRRLPLTVEDVELLAQRVGANLPRWRRERTEAEISLRVRTDRTMAEALGMPAGRGLLASGLPLSAAETANQAALLLALQTHVGQLASAVAQHDGDVTTGQAALLQSLPERVRSRYQQWILQGERAGVLGK